MKRRLERSLRDSKFKNIERRCTRIDLLIGCLARARESVGKKDRGEVDERRRGKKEGKKLHFLLLLLLLPRSMAHLRPNCSQSRQPAATRRRRHDVPGRGGGGSNSATNYLHFETGGRTMLPSFLFALLLPSVERRPRSRLSCRWERVLLTSSWERREKEDS